MDEVDPGPDPRGPARPGSPTTPPPAVPVPTDARPAGAGPTDPPTEPAPDDAAPVGSGRVVAVAALGTMVALIAFTLPLADLTDIAGELGAGVAARTWILSSMSIGLSAALLPSGAVADDYGRRRTFVAGLVALAVGGVLSAVAPGAGLFVAARVVQGIGAGAAIAASLGVISHTFPPGPRRAAASGVWGASVGAGIAVGPLLAAGTVALGSWRTSYWLLAALALLLAVWARLGLAESVAPERRGLDLPGALLVAAGLSALLAGLVEGRMGWTRPVVLVLLAAAVVLLAGFLVVEARSASAMLPLELLRFPRFRASSTAAFATGAGAIALFSYLGGFVGVAFGATATDSALLVLAWAATSVVTALAARRLPARLAGPGQLAVALAGVGVGQLVLLGLAPDSSLWHLVPGLVLTGVASGVLNGALGREAVASVPAGRGGLGSGANNTARYVGSAIGVTVVAVIAVPAASGSGAAALVAGWNTAVLVTALVSFAGAVAVVLFRPGRSTAPVTSAP